MGHLYLLIRLKIVRDFDERNFYAVLFTGKQLNVEDPSVFEYDPYETVGRGLKVVKQLDTKAAEPSTQSNAAVIKILTRLFGEERQKRLESLQKVVAEMKKPPQELLRLIEDLSKPLTPSSFSFNDYMDIVLHYLNGKVSITRSDLTFIIGYLIDDFVPKDENDFPMGLVSLRHGWLNDLITKTKDLPDGHPFKWTVERINKVEQLIDSGNYYHALIYFNDLLYAWFIYELDEEFPDEYVIRAKYLLDNVLAHVTEFYFSNLIVIKKEYSDRVQAVCDIVCDFVLNRGFDTKRLMLSEQRENTFVLKVKTLPKEIVTTMHRMQKKVHLNPAKVKSFLLEHALIAPFSLI